MVTILESGVCFCAPAIAGVVHVQAFTANDPYDAESLPADGGGLAYLGRVRAGRGARARRCCRSPRRASRTHPSPRGPSSSTRAEDASSAQVTLDDGLGRVAVADHYMKWAFHLLVDADEASPYFGKPLRLYGPYGVRQVLRDWSDDADSMLFDIPARCILRGDACRAFAGRD